MFYIHDKLIVYCACKLVVLTKSLTYLSQNNFEVCTGGNGKTSHGSAYCVLCFNCISDIMSSVIVLEYRYELSQTAGDEEHGC